MGRNLSKMGRNLCGTKSVKNGTKSVKIRRGTKSVWNETCHIQSIDILTSHFVRTCDVRKFYDIRMCEINVKLND